MLQITFANL